MIDYLSDKSERLKKIKSGRGIQHVLNKVYEILENPIAMYDLTEYKLLACAEGIVTDDSFLNELIAQGAFSKTTLEYCKEELWFDTVANEDIVAFIDSGTLKYDRIVGKLFNKDNILVAGLIVVACDKPFEDGDLELVKIVCKIISKELGKSEFYENYGQEFRETLVRKLIEGSIQDKGYFTPYVADIYSGLEPNLYLAVADITQCDPTYTKLTYFRDLFKRKQSDCKYFVYSNYIVMIISTNEETFDLKKDLKKLSAIFAENDICVGISSCFDNLFILQKHYKEAVIALHDGQITNCDQRIFLFDEIK